VKKPRASARGILAFSHKASLICCIYNVYGHEEGGQEFIVMRLAERLNDFDGYLGTEMNLILTKMRHEGKDVINLGLGDPDVIPTEHMRQTLAEACLSPDHHHYPSFYSPMPLKEAIAGWYQKPLWRESRSND
jgi:hypothetical protein